MPIRHLCLLALLPLMQSAAAAELASDTLRLPLAPATAQRVMHVSASGLDPAKPVWVKFELVGISASDKPTGDLVLDAMPLEQRVDLSKSMVRFDAAKLTVQRPEAALVKQLEGSVGSSSPQDLEARLGADMTRAFEAVRSGRGSVVQGTQVRQYDAPGKSALTFSTSVERTTDIQPITIKVTLGQGDMPVSEAERARSLQKDKIWAGVFGLLFALGFWWWRRRRND